MNRAGQKTFPAPVAQRQVVLPEGDPCPQCNEADLEAYGGKHRCPVCGFLQPCCQPGLR